MRRNRFPPWLFVGVMSAVSTARLQAAPRSAPPRPVGREMAVALSGVHWGPGLTPLMLAAFAGDTARVNRLLADGADVNGRDRNGMTALMWADRDTSLILLSHGAGVLIPDHFGRTPLHFAAYFADIPLISALIKRSAPLEARDNHGRTPLFYALLANSGSIYALGGPRGEQTQTLEDLAQAHVTARSADWQYLPSRRVEAIHTLLDDGARVDAADDDGKTPLMYALSFGSGWRNPVSDPGFQALLAKGPT
jgi:uncharacterized protein